jgi:hypothetical protein
MPTVLSKNRIDAVYSATRGWRLNDHRAVQSVLYGLNALLPAPYATGIDVNEIRFPIVPDSPKFEFQSRIPQFPCIKATQADINGPAENMLAVLGDARTPAAQDSIGFLGTVGRDHFECIAVAGHALDFPQDIHQLWIDFALIAVTPVGEEDTQLLHGFEEVEPIFEIGYFQRVQGMCVVELQGPGVIDFPCR